VSNSRILKLHFYFPYPLVVLILSHRDVDIKFMAIFSVDPEGTSIRKAIPPKRWLIFTEIQKDSKLLSGFLCPIILRPYVLSKARMLKLFSILQY
jgi:hypothetical protein